MARHQPNQTATMKRGEIWTTETEPVLLVGSDILHDNNFPITYIVPITNHKPEGVDYPYTLKLDDTLWAKIYAVTHKPTSQLQHKTGTTPTKNLDRISKALTRLFDLERFSL